MILHIIRHADPDYEHDTITPFGHQEAQALAQWLDNTEIHRIYTSPMGRAIATASYTCQRKNIQPEILPWTAESWDYMQPFTRDSHCEYRFSTTEGVTDYVDFAETDRMPSIRRLISSSDELIASLGYRRQGIFYEITAPNDETVAVFCHGGFGSAWIAHLLGYPPALGFSSLTMNTSSVTTFSFHNNDSGYTRPSLVRLNDVRHIQQAGLRYNHR